MQVSCLSRPGIYLLAMLATALSSTSLAWVSVGESPGFGACDYTSVQDAIDSGENEIRILDNEVFQENLLLTGSHTLRGGFTSCLAASANQQLGDVSEIDGSGASTLPTVSLAISGTGTVTFEKLLITGGATGIASGGLDGVLNIRDSRVGANGGFQNGGGLAIGNPSDTFQVVIDNSAIIGNSATDLGGGIYCDSSQTNIRLESGGILENVSGGDGGGVYVSGGCNFSSYAGTSVENGSVLAGVMFNQAAGSGGGIHASGGSEVLLNGHFSSLGLWGNNTDPASLANNTASSEGGGIYAAGAATRVEFIDVVMRDNSSGSLGGGAFVTDGATLIADLSGSDCWNGFRCSQWRNNEVTGGNRYGGHLYASAGATVSIDRTHLTGGRAELGTAVYARGAGTVLDAEGSYFAGNGLYLPPGATEQYVIRLFDGAEANLLHASLGANLSGTAALGVSGSASRLTVENSIVYNGSFPVLSVSGGPTTSFVCTLGNESSSTSGAVTVIDPQFRDTGSSDLRLTAGSGAIDRCADAGATLPDTEHDDRGLDDPNQADLFGRFDAGADELILVDAIFSDRFDQ